METFTELSRHESALLFYDTTSIIINLGVKVYADIVLFILRNNRCVLSMKVNSKLMFVVIVWSDHISCVC